MSTLLLPSAREEAWRWSDLPAIDAARAIAAPTDENRPVAPVLPDAARLCFVGGQLDEVRSDRGDIDVSSGSIASDHPLARHAAGQGHVIHVAAGAARAVEIERVATGGDNHAAVEIVLGDDAVLSVVETYVGAGWSNSLTRFRLGRGARLMRAVRILQGDGYVSIRDEADLGGGASFVSIALGAGSAGLRVDAAITLSGDGGFAEYGGALLTRAALRQEAAVVVRHAAPNGSSRQVWRAVADDTSAASIAARVEVARDAQKTDGEQSLRGLLLRRTATVNLKPELEIFADDVKCAHGATVGELSASALFYLESRGIPPVQARALLTRAFVGDAIDRIGDEAVREAFQADAAAWLDAPR